MPLPADLESTTGAQELYDWFGYWPEFHDAEILSFQVGVGMPSTLAIHTWETTNSVNESGFYELAKHVVVEFVISNVSLLNLEHLWPHSILFDLAISKTEAGFRLDLSSSYGLSGVIEAKEVSLRMTPGLPSPSNTESSSRTHS